VSRAKKHDGRWLSFSTPSAKLRVNFGRNPCSDRREKSYRFLTYVRNDRSRYNYRLEFAQQRSPCPQFLRRLDEGRDAGAGAFKPAVKSAIRLGAHQ
jgi:hypothetical protein